jgi:tripartite-type tricarboxylate transporter receptor subunit TctC
VTNALTEHNPNINLVYYKGSSNIQAGVVSGEVDAILSDRGMWMQENGHVNCIFNTSLKDKNGTSPLSHEINNPELSYEFMVYAYTHNMETDLRDELLNTFQNALQTPELVSHYKKENWDSVIQQTAPKTQVEFFNNNMPE